MSDATGQLMSDADALRAQYRRLDLHEEDLKRRMALDQQNFAAVRELKKQIAQQIFNATDTRGSRTSLNEVTTAYNGQNRNQEPI